MSISDGTFFSSAGSLVDGIGVQTRNEFLRPSNDNCAVLAQIAIEATERNGRVFPVVEIGCSAGRDTWLMASLIASKGLPFKVEGIDVNPIVVEEAQKPYKGTLASLEQELGNWGVSRDCLDFFERVDADHFQPNDELRRGVGFRVLNLWKTSLKEGIESGTLSQPFDGAVINNVFCNLETRNSHLIPIMIGNIISGLNPGGIFSTVEGDAVVNPPQYGLSPLQRGSDIYGRPRFFEHTVR